jgi:hypothetical protein
MDSKHRALRCTISRGGFSDERVFEFDTDGGKYRGVASRRHMWTLDRRPIEGGEPPIGKTMDGYVAARIIETEGGRATVSIPSGDVVTLPLEQLVERPSTAGQHVPV